MVEVSSQKVSFSWKKVVRKNKTLSLTFLQKCLFVEKRQCKKTLFSRFCLALRNVENRSIGRIFMFFNCTMARDIPKMGKILELYILEILGHPNGIANQSSKFG